MAAISDQARAFVNMIVNTYDERCHPLAEKIPDVFNPPKGFNEVKDWSLKRFSQKYAQEDPAAVDAQVVAAYTKSSPTLSHLLFYTGMLDAPLKDAQRQKAKDQIVEPLIQDHLKKKKFKKDFMTSISHQVASWMRKPEPPFPNAKRHFYSQIFQEVYGKSTVAGKKKIIERLQAFEPLLKSRSFWYQRGVFKVEGMFNRIITDKHIKIGICVGMGAGFYILTTYALVPLAVQFFNSSIFTSMGAGVASHMPAVVVQISSGAYTGIVALIAYVASTRIYLFLFNSKMGPFVGSFGLNYLGQRFWPTSLIASEIGSYVFKPISTPAQKIGLWMYERTVGPDIRAQMAISAYLARQVEGNKCTAEEANRLLAEGMKAYQIWMYLMEQGAQEGVFKPVCP
jgi:hypothetical protein